MTTNTNTTPKLKLPIASKQRLSMLLEYLGIRADDFKQCFDTESKWCWKYADLMLRGLQDRNFEYAERHHIIPFAYYKENGVTCHRWHVSVCTNNVSVLSFGEHVYAHYCLAQCARGFMIDKSAHAFWKMYQAKTRGKKKILPDEKIFVDTIPQIEAERIRGLIAEVANVENSGRKHKWEGGPAYSKSYREANIDIIRKKNTISM